MFEAFWRLALVVLAWTVPLYAGFGRDRDPVVHLNQIKNFSAADPAVVTRAQIELGSLGVELVCAGELTVDQAVVNSLGTVVVVGVFSGRLLWGDRALAGQQRPYCLVLRASGERALLADLDYRTTVRLFEEGFALEPSEEDGGAGIELDERGEPRDGLFGEGVPPLIDIEDTSGEEIIEDPIGSLANPGALPPHTSESDQ